MLSKGNQIANFFVIPVGRYLHNHEERYAVPRNSDNRLPIFVSVLVVAKLVYFVRIITMLLESIPQRS